MKSLIILINVIIIAMFGATTIYDVDLSFNDNLKAQHAIQTFIATVDSISEVSFFCGEKILHGRYQFQLEDVDENPISVWMNSDSAGRYAYELVTATFTPKIPVKKGFKYRLHIRHSHYNNYSTNFYYNRSNPYPDGELIGHPGCDLAARIVGVNNFLKDLFGMNSGMTVTPNQQPRTFWHKELWKPGIDSMKAMGVTWDRTGFCAWQHFQWENKTPQDTVYKWG